MGKASRRDIYIENLDGTSKELDIGKFSVAHLYNDIEFIYIEKIKDGKWRLTATDKTIPDMSQVKLLRIIREDKRNGNYNKNSRNTIT